MKRPMMYTDVADLVEETLASVGRRVRLAMPIGAGQPVHLANEFYRRAKADPSIDLKLLTGLSLEPPRPRTGLERRFWQPVLGRLFPGIPYPDYIGDAREGRLPANVALTEFYVRPGGFLNVPAIQWNYSSSNYTHIARDMEAAGANVGAAQLARRTIGGRQFFSISSNASASLDLMKRIIARRDRGERVELLGVINGGMPFLYGGSVQAPEVADRVLDNPGLYHPLFPALREPVTPQEAMIGLYASALVRDGGTLQIGIGGIGEAIGEGLIVRRNDNRAWRRALSDTGALERFGQTIDHIGGLDPLPRGLYGCTEMMTHPFIRLFEAGIISREVFDWQPLQALVAEAQAPDGRVTPRLLERLLEMRAVGSRLEPDDVARLVAFGILKPGCELRNGRLLLDGAEYETDLGQPGAIGRLAGGALGSRLSGGVLIHAGFFMGPAPFYRALGEMDDSARARICMREISFVNQLYGQEELKRLQRTEARFFNTAMMVTALGGAASDMLESGQVVSGVGGQYNFVAMAHALADGRSVLMARAARERPDGATSNVLWSYGHTTIPRHLRDIYLTEYGVADVRSLPDHEVIEAMLAITDSRFQQPLLETAKRNGKLRPDYRIPDRHRANTPERIAADVAGLRAVGLMPAFPSGSDFSPEELLILAALKAQAGPPVEGSDAELLARLPSEAGRCLERMGLDTPESVEERAEARALLSGLARHLGVATAG